MKKLTKKQIMIRTVNPYEHECDICCTGCIQEGKNQACKEWEKFLPSEKEIWCLIASNVEGNSFKGVDGISVAAKAIHKRIRG